MMQSISHSLLISVLPIATLFGCGGNNFKQAGQPAQGLVITLGVEEFAKAVEKGDMRLIDVRTPLEYAEGHHQGAENIDVKAPDFAERAKGVEGTVAVYCLGGRRSHKAAKLLAAQGCTVYNLNGGITAWKKAGMPTNNAQ